MRVFLDIVFTSSQLGGLLLVWQQTRPLVRARPGHPVNETA
jgi:hypothetical protein